MIEIPVVQYIISDCKGTNLSCGRKGSRSLLMNGLCCDCNIESDDDNNSCIYQELICSFHCKDQIIGKTTVKLNEHVFLAINNDFHDISFGGCGRSMYGATAK